MAPTVVGHSDPNFPLSTGIENTTFLVSQAVRWRCSAYRSCRIILTCFTYRKEVYVKQTLPLASRVHALPRSTVSWLFPHMSPALLPCIDHDGTMRSPGLHQLLCICDRSCTYRNTTALLNRLLAPQRDSTSSTEAAISWETSVECCSVIHKGEQNATKTLVLQRRTPCLVNDMRWECWHLARVLHVNTRFLSKVFSFFWTLFHLRIKYNRRHTGVNQEARLTLTADVYAWFVYRES
ncbi:hypothetical protein BC835DRAFT_770251 [Cytidiella melzeri]|nr:hypothetical protein BC835DRAFT_770251 [Cytidiella melzeri]